MTKYEEHITALEAENVRLRTENVRLRMALERYVVTEAKLKSIKEESLDDFNARLVDAEASKYFCRC